MKNLFLASLALAVVVAAPATAADLPFEAPPPLPVAYYDWSGAYVGFNVGGTHYNVTHHFPSPGAITPDVTTGDHDAIFGVHAGAQALWTAFPTLKDDFTYEWFHKAAQIVLLAPFEA